MLPRLHRSTRAALRHNHIGVRNFVHLSSGGWNGIILASRTTMPPPGTRSFIGVARIVRGLLKVRYIVLGGAAAGGMTLNKKYDEWMENIPDVKWIRDLMPDKEQWEGLRGTLISFSDKVKDFEIAAAPNPNNNIPDPLLTNNINYPNSYIDEELWQDPRLRQLPEEKYRQLREWFDERLDAAIAAAEKDNQKPRPLSDGLRKLSDVANKLYTETRGAALTEASAAAANTKEDTTAAFDRLQTELDEMRRKYRQLERDSRREQETLSKENKALVKENKEMRRTIALAREQAALGIVDDRRNGKRIRTNVVDMYSEVLDELAEFDVAYSGQDHLPRVVVVGDQSSGKTSVLEMIAQARIFPRGAGEMMTRAPVKVTLSEGPYHMAQFKDSPREYDLTNEKDLRDLRAHVEERMRASVERGQTVSSKEIAMTVKGPGLQRMVLVDLPGIISTVTTDMAQDTREAIKAMSMKHMSNPNAIILCVQDGSVDAERSNVTDLVSKMDPNGKRTIFVLTKVDLAEKQLASPERIERILAGKLFPMRALGYFAVVTGRGRGDESIESILSYEEDFFRRSRLFGSSGMGSVPASQVTTRNMSRAVSDCFWQMVSETVEQQADAFKAIRYNLETEWKNNFARLREMDRDELFVRARDEILDQVVSLGQVAPAEWERLITDELWKQASEYVLENIYLPALAARDSATFNTKADIVLREWASDKLPQLSVDAGWATLARQLQRSFELAESRSDHDALYDALKKSVIQDALTRHSWEKRALGVLRTLQTERLEDRVVAEKSQWDEAVYFLEKSIKDKMFQADTDIHDHMGPGRRERWLRWRSQTPEQAQHDRIRIELEKLLQAEPKHGSQLSIDEVRMVQAALQLSGDLDAPTSAIRETWNVLYRRHAWQSSFSRAQDCRKAYFMHQQGMVDPEAECHDVVLFWRIQQVLKVTASALRNQVVNREARRLSDEIKEVLDEYGNDQERKRTLLTGRRVQLAEDLKRVRRIQELLEEFIHALANEK